MHHLYLTTKEIESNINILSHINILILVIENNKSPQRHSTLYNFKSNLLSSPQQRHHISYALTLTAQRSIVKVYLSFQFKNGLKQKEKQQ